MDASTLPATSFERAGLQFSRIGLGTAPLGLLYSPVPEEQALETIQCALENGVSFFDTAPYYGSGLAEQRLGRALAGIPRSRYVLSTKVGRIILPDGEPVFDFSRDGVRRSLEASLQRLGIDQVDILLIHDPDHHYRQALDEAFPALAELRAQGVIKAVGAGMNQWQMLADFVRNADFDCFLLAGRYTLLEQGAQPLLELCQSRQVAIFIGGVLNSGILATGARPGATYNYAFAAPEVMERVARLEAVCVRHAVPLPAAALQFPLAHPAVTALLIGARAPQEYTDNLRLLQRPIPAELWSDLRAEGLLEAAVPVPGG